MSRTSHPSRRGFTLVYLAVSMAVIMGLVSLCVDLGRAQLVKMELQRTADAAARYASTGINDSTAVTKALAVAAENSADGSSVVLQSADVTVGTWNSTTLVFTAGGSTPNAVRVIAQRTAARNNAVPTLFMQAMGRRTVDVKATSIALFTPTPTDYDIIALGSIALSNSASITARYDEPDQVQVASNGTWSTANTSVVSGRAYYRGAAPSANITGTKTYMATDLAYPAVTLPGSYVNLGNYTLSGGTNTVDSSNYYVTGLTVTGAATLNINNTNGPINVYANGPVTIDGTTFVNTGGNARKFYIYGMGNNTITIAGSVNLYIMIYAPTCTVNISSARVYGSVVCKNLIMSGTSNLEYTSLNAPVAPTSGGTTPGTVSMVK